MDAGDLQDFVLEALGPGNEVRALTEMVGGIAARVFRADVRSPTGDTESFVVRVLDPAFFAPESAAAELSAEADTLRFLETQGSRLEVHCPRLLALELDAVRLGGPAMLAAFIPGTVDIAPRDIPVWASALAGALPQVHHLRPEDAPTPLRRMGTGPPTRAPEPPAWLDDVNNETRDSWHAVLEAAARGVPEAAPVFIHGDYHPTNIVWNDGCIVGVLDWTNACVGPVGIDLAHCRINLVCLFGVETANHFLGAYRDVGLEEAADDFLQARCDAVRCWTDASVYPPWAALGRPDLTEALLRTRLDAYAVDIARRLRAR